MADLKRALEAVAELLYPKTGVLPYRVTQADTPDMGAGRLDLEGGLKGQGFAKDADIPVLALVYRGTRKEPIVMMHGHEFLRLLKGAEG